jgi:signal transduction histidine kinase
MAKAIVDKNEGTMTVESQPGQGTTFTIRLQAAPESI